MLDWRTSALMAGSPFDQNQQRDRTTAATVRAPESGLRPSSLWAAPCHHTWSGAVTPREPSDEAYQKTAPVVAKARSRWRQHQRPSEASGRATASDPGRVIQRVTRGGIFWVHNTRTLAKMKVAAIETCSISPSTLERSGVRSTSQIRGPERAALDRYRPKNQLHQSPPLLYRAPGILGVSGQRWLRTDLVR